MTMYEKKAILEAALYVADEPLGTETIADIMNLGSKGYVQTLVDQFKEELEQESRGLELIKTENGYVMQVKREHVDDVAELAPHRDLSEAALRTLSLIAYNAPVKQSKIIDIRGNRAYSQINDLEDRNLVESSKEGRTKLLDVTDDFLDYFGLESLDEFREQTSGLEAGDDA